MKTTIGSICLMLAMIGCIHAASFEKELLDALDALEERAGALHEVRDVAPQDSQDLQERGLPTCTREDQSHCYQLDNCLARYWEERNKEECPSLCGACTECYEGNGQSYRGFQYRAVKNNVNYRCARWTEGGHGVHRHSMMEDYGTSAGLGDHSYCRNPDASERPWCYTSSRAERWVYCNIEKC